MPALIAIGVFIVWVIGLLGGIHLCLKGQPCAGFGVILLALMAGGSVSTHKETDRD